MYCLFVLALSLLCVNGQVCKYEIHEAILSTILNKRRCRTVKVQGQKILAIQPNTFKGLAKLREIYLGRNYISVIKGGMFEDLNSLLKLHLEKNKFN